MQIPKEAQGTIFQLQQYQQQAQLIAMQKQQLEMRIKEIDSALSYLESSKEKEVYKSIGPVLAKEKKKKVKEELKDMKEALEVKVKSFSKQEDKIKKKLKELSEKASKFFQAKNEKLA